MDPQAQSLVDLEQWQTQLEFLGFWRLDSNTRHIASLSSKKDSELNNTTVMAERVPQRTTVNSTRTATRTTVCYTYNDSSNKYPYYSQSEAYLKAPEMQDFASIHQTRLIVFGLGVMIVWIWGLSVKSVA